MRMAITGNAHGSYVIATGNTIVPKRSDILIARRMSTFLFIPYVMMFDENSFKINKDGDISLFPWACFVKFLDLMMATCH